MIRMLGKSFKVNWAKNRFAIIQLTVIFFMINISGSLLSQIIKEKDIYNRYGVDGNFMSVKMAGSIDLNEDFEEIHEFFDRLRKYEYVKNVYLEYGIGVLDGDKKYSVMIINKASAETYYQNDNIYINDKEGELIGYINKESNKDFKIGDSAKVKEYFKDSFKEIDIVLEGKIDPFYSGTSENYSDIIIAIDDLSELKYLLSISIIDGFAIELTDKKYQSKLKDDIIRDYKIHDITEKSLEILNDTELLKERTLTQMSWIDILSIIIVVIIMVGGIGLCVWIYYTFSQRKYEYGVRLYIGSSKRNLISLIMGEITSLYVISYFLSWTILSIFVNNKSIIGDSIKITVTLGGVLTNSLFIALLTVVTLILVCIYVNKISIGKVIKGDVDAN
ncbi:MAG: ABC transporter permease [Clostridium sp.]